MPGNSNTEERLFIYYCDPGEANHGVDRISRINIYEAAYGESSYMSLRVSLALMYFGGRERNPGLAR